MRTAFDADQCDLCGGTASRAIVDLETARAMRSDRDVVPQRLEKLECLTCGLVRSGTAIPSERLGDYYAEHYRLSLQPEHAFYTPEGPVARSRVFADWMITAAPARWQAA